MTQFQTGAEYADPYATPTRTSGLAVTALVCSLFFCIPIAPIGVLLGLIALVVIGSNPNLRGRGLALAAIVLGLIVSAGWAIASWQLYKFGREAYTFVVEGPAPALQLGASGDIAGFQAAFTGTGATADEAEARAFLETLETRYGRFVSGRLDESAGQPNSQPGQPMIEMPYVLQFANKTVDAEAELVFADQQTGQMMFKLGWILIKDDEAGDLRFPPLPPPPSGPSDPASGDTAGDSAGGSAGGSDASTEGG